MYFFVFLPKLIGPSEKDLESKLAFGAALELGMYMKFWVEHRIFSYYPNSMHSKKRIGSTIATIQQEKLTACGQPGRPGLLKYSSKFSKTYYMQNILYASAPP